MRGNIDGSSPHQLQLIDDLLVGGVNPFRHYAPRGTQARLLWSEDPEVLVSGPAGTGKSRAALEKLNYCALRYPGMRGLILRKTRESLSESGLLTFERDVLGYDNPMVSGPNRRNRSVYTYPNGSEIIVGGLKVSGRDQTQRIMSTDYDMIFVQEAVELNEDEWEKATTRLRSGVMPFQQLISDTNPSYPYHWLKVRSDGDLTLRMESVHEENPLLWDNVRGKWTPLGVEYIARLDRLTGARKSRLRWGRWVQAEGIVYDEWDPSVHLIDDFDIPEEWDRYRAIDFGFKNPFNCQWWGVDGDGRMYLYREIYFTERTVSKHAEQIRELEHWHLMEPELDEDGNETGELVPRVDRRGKPVPNPDREIIKGTICDHSASDRATLAEEGIATKAAKKAMSRGIQKVKDRLALAGDGKPRLFIMRGALVEEDPSLKEANKPLSTVQEIDGYVWSNAKTKETPVKEDDHGMDDIRYMAMELDTKYRRGYHGTV